MPHIELRKKSGVRSPNDIIVSVQDRTFEYLQNTITPEIRVSAYLDRDYEIVDQDYEEIFVSESCPFESKIISMTAGSPSRKGIVLPGPMSNGEQLIIVVKRSSLK
jgi:hypothetical protein